MFKIDNNHSLNSELGVFTKTIYHYTSYDVLPVFFEPSADLYCTKAQWLNDPTEVLAGAYGFAKWLYSSGVLSESRYRLLLTNIRETIGQDWFDLWVMSLSSENDDLPQWRGYTSREHGGYAIGFNVNKLVRALSKITQIELSEGGGSANKIPFLVRCWYTKQDSLLIESLYKDIFLKYANDFVVYDSSPSLDAEKIRAVISSIMTASMHIKDDGFRSEKEARIALTVPGCNYNDKKILGGKPRMPVGIPLLGEPLHTYIDLICISPHGDRDALKNQVERLKVESGASFLIQESVIPYDSSR